MYNTTVVNLYLETLLILGSQGWCICQVLQSTRSRPRDQERFCTGGGLSMIFLFDHEQVFVLSIIFNIYLRRIHVAM